MPNLIEFLSFLLAYIMNPVNKPWLAIVLAVAHNTIILYKLLLPQQCLNSDGVRIKLDVTYQYRVQMVNLRKIIMDFKDFDGFEKVLHHVGMLTLIVYYYCFFVGCCCVQWCWEPS